MRMLVRILLASLALYLLLALGLAALYFGWLPGADAVLGGRAVHSYGYYLAHLSKVGARLLAGLAAVGAVLVGFRFWVRANGGWRRFLPRFAFLLVFTALLAEIALRVMFSGAAGRRAGWVSADLLADPNTDNAYWVLSARLSGGVERDYVVPLRGWSQSRPDEGNPPGLRDESMRALQQEEPKVYFFGDSFVQGMPFNEKSLPVLVDERVPGRSVVNLGVRGYGVDQMYLFAREVGLPEAGGEVWVGILTWDLDRAYLEYSHGQRPRYRIVDDQLVLAHTPGPQTDQEFVEAYRMPFRTWLAQAVRRRWQLREGLERGGPERDEKISLNRAILREWSTWARSNGTPVKVVLFRTRQDLAQDGWRARAIHEICRELELPLFDTADVLLPYIKAQGTWGAELYQPGDFHHTDLANHLIADGLSAWNGKTKD